MSSRSVESPRAKRIEKEKTARNFPGRKVIFDFGNQKYEIRASEIAFYSQVIFDQLSDFPDQDIEYEMNKIAIKVSPEELKAILDYLVFRYDNENVHKADVDSEEIKDENGITSYSALNFLPEEKDLINQVKLADKVETRPIDWKVKESDKKMIQAAKRCDIYNHMLVFIDYFEMPIVEDFIIQLMAEIIMAFPADDTSGYLINKKERLDAYARYQNYENLGYIPGISINFSTEELYDLLTRYGDTTDYLELTDDQKRDLMKKYGKNVFDDFMANEYNDNTIPPST